MWRYSFFFSDLNRLARLAKTDKYGSHYYTPNYDRHFRPIRKNRNKLLEIGVGGYDDPYRGGASLLMWKYYFKNSQIFAIDINDKSLLEDRRIKIFRGSQVDLDFLDGVVKLTGPLDIIIDDGSHQNEHVVKTFNHLFKHLREGGIYAIEDVQTSYWESFGGDSKDLKNPNTIMNYFKQMTDSLNYEEFLLNEYEPTYFDKHVVSVHFYHNMIFIHKGVNNEGSVRHRLSAAGMILSAKTSSENTNGVPGTL